MPAKRTRLPKPPAGMDRVGRLDGCSMLRSTLPRTLLDEADAINRRVSELWARIEANNATGEVPFKAEDFAGPGRGARAEKWLDNPAHLLGLHAVMGTLLDNHYVTCADAIKLFMDTANSLIDFLAANVPALRQIPAT